MAPPAVTGELAGLPPGGELLLTRLAPPAQHARLLRRQRVEGLLATALELPLCLLVAPAGSGKSAALAALAEHGGWPSAWCRAHAGEEPALLLRHLAAAFRQVAQVDEPALAAALAHAGGDWRPALHGLVNQLAALDDDTLLVIDDYQLIDGDPGLSAIFEDLLGMLPRRLHLALATRVEPALAAAKAARLRGELLMVGSAELAFDAAEAGGLFARAAQPAPPFLGALLDETRGWPLAVQLASSAADWRAALGLTGPAPLDAFFEREVLAETPPELTAFLLATSSLPALEPALCAAILGGAPAEQHLDALWRRRLFVERADDGALRIQPIFRAFLDRRARTDRAGWSEQQRRIAAHSYAAGDRDRQLHHLLLAGDEDAAVSAVIEAAPAALVAGQPERVLAWIALLPAARHEHPRLLELQAAAQRRLGRYEPALEAEAAAERVYAASGDLDGQVRTLRGLAEVYLYTVQPAQAADLLKRALKLLPEERAAERAGLLRMQAENWANRGRADVALILERAAARVGEGGTASRSVSPSPLVAPPPPLPPRILLRAGLLNEARLQLEAQLQAESQADAARSGMHGEPLLLLSLIYAMLGSGHRSLAMAQRGLDEARHLGSQLTEAIAQLRLGHAYQLIAPSDAAQRYAEGLRLIQRVGVARTRAEACLGLTLLNGHSGDIAGAEAEARQGLQVAALAGDEWVAALILLALGGAAVAAGDRRGLGWLDQARQRFARGGDSYGQAMVSLWRAAQALRDGDEATGDVELGRLFEAVGQHAYAGAIIAPSLFGPRDMAALVPLLLRGRAMAEHHHLAEQLLRQGFPAIAADDTVEQYHPGYTLRVQMLGTFRVWRGLHEIHAREWQREKARQLLQLLLTYRGQWVQREQICAWLWPDADLDAAERQFKVTLNALNAALEPARPPRVAPFFVRRQGLAYSFAPSYGAWIDVDEFELRAAAADDDLDFARRNAQAAVQLYHGDYLAESLYDAWTTEERERLLARYLAAAVEYAARLSGEGEQAQAVQLCEQVLRRDRCYEEAYQTLIRAHARAGSRSLALRSYARCAQALGDELGMEPLPETIELYERLKRNEAL
jgi:LuxR family maltose regulon positive regulatory protein